MATTADPRTTTTAAPHGIGPQQSTGRWIVELAGPSRWEDGHLFVEQGGHRWSVQRAGAVVLRGRLVADDGLAAALCAGDRLGLVRTGMGIQLVGGGVG